MIPSRPPSGFLWTVRIRTSLNFRIRIIQVRSQPCVPLRFCICCPLALGSPVWGTRSAFSSLVQPTVLVPGFEIMAQPWLCGSMGQVFAGHSSTIPSNAVHYGSASGPVASIWRPTPSTPVFRSGNLNLFSSLPNVLRLQRIARQIFSHFPMPPSRVSHDDVGQEPVKIGFL